MRTFLSVILFASALLAQTSNFPASLDTDTSLFVAKDNIQTTLASPMLAGDNVAIVTSGTGWAANMIATICDSQNAATKVCTSWEHMLVTAVNSNVLTVTRAFAGTVAAGHANKATVSALIDSVHQTSLKAAVLALESSAGTGAVVMRRAIGANSTWTISLPNGLTLTPADSCQGLQTAVTYAQQHAFSLIVWGGGITPPNASPASTALNTITCAATLAFPTGWQNQYQFWGITLVLNTGSSDGITFDSTDVTNVDFYDSQIIYTGTAAAVHFNPATNNGESFAGFTTSTFNLAHVICAVSSVNLAPDATKGTGIRISAPALGLGLLNGNGIYVNNIVSAVEINACATGIQLDNPGGSGSQTVRNRFTFPSIHSQGTIGITQGTSAGAANNIFANHWTANVADPGLTNGVSIFSGSSGGGDLWNITATGPTNCINLQSSALGQTILSSYLACTNPVANNATTHTSRLFVSGAPTRTVQSVGGSPWTFQNTTLRPMSVFVSGASITAIAISADNVTYDSASTPPTNSYYYIPPGAYLKVTYSAGAPSVFSYY